MNILNRQSRSIAAACILLISVTLPAHVLAQSTGPRVSLFPEAVTAELAVTRDTARAMEAGMVDIVQTMKKQKALFDQSKCDGDASDSTGCLELINQISVSYVNMLDKMSESLPEMKRSVSNTEKMLQKRIARELGRKRTADQLQNDILAQGSGAEAPYRGPTTSGRSIAAVFERQFRRLGQTGNQSIMSMASEIYLDMRAASGWIERLDAQIKRQRLIAEVQGPAMITPDMDATINEVTSMILGDAGDSGIIDAPSVDSPAESPAGERFTM